MLCKEPHLHHSLMKEKLTATVEGVHVAPTHLKSFQTPNIHLMCCVLRARIFVAGYSCMSILMPGRCVRFLLGFANGQQKNVFCYPLLPLSLSLRGRKL